MSIARNVPCQGPLTSRVSIEGTQLQRIEQPNPASAMMTIMKKQTLVALALLLLIPVVIMGGGFLSNLINPEIAAGHPNYPRNFQLLTLAKNLTFLGSGLLAGILWILSCYLVIRSKERSIFWLLCAALGPIGFAILMTLNDNVPKEMDWHARFVRSLNIFVRIVYEACRFVAVWWLAYQAMVLKRHLMIIVQSASTGLSRAQIIDQQNASSGMWAFGEGLEVIYLAALFYLLWPIVFNLAARIFRKTAPTAP